MTALPDKELIGKVAEALGLGAVVPEVYRDLLQPSAREIGASLLVVARAVRIALAPVEATVWGYDQIRDWLAIRLTAKLAQTLPDDIVAPPGHIAGPAILNLHFAASQENLREMYANLLATSMDRSQRSSAHPAYVSIISQLDPDEARILARIAELESPTLFEEVLSPAGYPRSGSDWLFNQWRGFCQSLSPPIVDSADEYLDNLLRLRVLRRESSSEIIHHPETADRHGVYPPSVEQTSSTILELTDFGQQFITACVLEPSVGNPWV